MKKELTSYLDLTDTILSRLSGVNDFDSSTNFLIETYFRSYDILIAIEKLDASELRQYELEHPTGILLRSGLYDFINFQYLSNSSLEKNGILNTKTFELKVKEHLSSHFNDIDESYELREDLKNLKSFSEFGKKKKFKTLGVLKEGKEFANSKKLNYLEKAILIWEWYSKYEHYGAFTHYMYKEEEENQNRKKIAIQLIMANIHLCLCTLIDLGLNKFELSELSRMEEIVLNFK